MHYGATIVCTTPANRHAPVSIDGAFPFTDQVQIASNTGLPTVLSFRQAGSEWPGTVAAGMKVFVISSGRSSPFLMKSSNPAVGYGFSLERDIVSRRKYKKQSLAHNTAGWALPPVAQQEQFAMIRARLRIGWASPFDEVSARTYTLSFGQGNDPMWFVMRPTGITGTTVFEILEHLLRGSGDDTFNLESKTSKDADAECNDLIKIAKIFIGMPKKIAATGAAAKLQSEFLDGTRWEFKPGV